MVHVSKNRSIGKDTPVIKLLSVMSLSTLTGLVTPFILVLTSM